VVEKLAAQNGNVVGGRVVAAFVETMGVCEMGVAEVKLVHLVVHHFDEFINISRHLLGDL
jgi:hypothetical protein